jgi:hypothetical protein
VGDWHKERSWGPDVVLLWGISSRVIGQWRTQWSEAPPSPARNESHHLRVMAETDDQTQSWHSTQLLGLASWIHVLAARRVWELQVQALQITWFPPSPPPPHREVRCWTGSVGTETQLWKLHPTDDLPLSRTGNPNPRPFESHDFHTHREVNCWAGSKSTKMEKWPKQCMHLWINEQQKKP